MAGTAAAYQHEAVVAITDPEGGPRLGVSREHLELEVLPKVAQYFAEASYGRVEFSFELDGRQTVEQVFPLVYDFDPLIDYRPYDHAIFIDQDGMFGLGTLGEEYYDVDGGVSLGVVQCGHFPITIAHELLHNFGLDDLYGEPNRVGAWDVMEMEYTTEDNKTAFPHPLAWTKLKLGWLGPENVREAKLGRTENIEIVALESTASRTLPRAIRVPAGGTEFFIELRKQMGVSVLFEEGVLVYSVRDRTVRVLGANPKSFGLGDAPFGQGEVFRNGDHRLQVEVLEVGEDMAEIRVTWLVELPELEIRAVPGMCFSVNGENFTADSEGHAQIPFWPGKVGLKAPERFVSRDGTKWFFRGWVDGENNASRTLEVLTDIALEPHYERAPRLSIRALPGTSVKVGGVAMRIPEKGVLETQVWPGKIRVEVQNEIKLKPGLKWVFSGWEELDGPHAIELEVRSNQKLSVGYRELGKLFAVVRDALGFPVEGARIDGAHTDADGRIELWLPVEQRSGELGYLSQHKRINIPPSSRDRARDTLRSFESGSWFGSCLPATHLFVRICEKVVCMRLTEILGSALVGIGAFLLVWAFWEARSILALNLEPGEIFSTAISMVIMFTTGGFILIRGIKLVEGSGARKRAEARG